MKYFICFSISLSTLWLLLISLQYAAITGWISIQLGHHLLSSFISFLWRKRNTNFDHLLHFPSGIFDQSCELSMLVFNFLFSSFTKESHEIVKLHWVSTKHIHTNFCWFTSLHIIPAILISYLLRLFACCWPLAHWILMQPLSLPMPCIASSSFCNVLLVVVKRWLC